MVSEKICHLILRVQRCEDVTENGVFKIFELIMTENKTFKNLNLEISGSVSDLLRKGKLRSLDVGKTRIKL